MTLLEHLKSPLTHCQEDMQCEVCGFYKIGTYESIHFCYFNRNGIIKLSERIGRRYMFYKNLHNKKVNK